MHIDRFCLPIFVILYYLDIIIKYTHCILYIIILHSYNYRVHFDNIFPFCTIGYFSLIKSSVLFVSVNNIRKL